jgi:hypothetical protein
MKENRHLNCKQEELYPSGAAIYQMNQLLHRDTNFTIPRQHTNSAHKKLFSQSVLSAKAVQRLVIGSALHSDSVTHDKAYAPAFGVDYLKMQSRPTSHKAHRNTNA